MPNQSYSIKFLAQGTVYPDVIESASKFRPDRAISSLTIMLGIASLSLPEPLRTLFKDEVRQLGLA